MAVEEGAADPAAEGQGDALVTGRDATDAPMNLMPMMVQVVHMMRQVSMLVSHGKVVQVVGSYFFQKFNDGSRRKKS